MAFLLGGSLIVSQIRAVHLYLSSHKLDYNRLLPQIERNYMLSMSTYFLGLAVIYKKLSMKPSESSYNAYDAYVEERTKMMRFSGFGDENQKKRQRCTECWQKFKERLTCKICRWGSPKFWQLVQNDIPLLMAIPVAQWFDLIDPYTASAAWAVTLIDLISMLTYLNHDDELSI